VIGFHPGFTSPRPGDSANLHASVLMICGADDPVVPAEDRRRFVDEMREANVADWRLEVYGGVGHSFTNPDIATRRLPGRFAYDERADRRSWASMLALLDETSADRDPAHVVRQPTAAGGATEAAAIHINLAAS
jgi:dienelactone hydrolase